ncbi:MAG: prephenate dehydratase [Anaerosomatales bacterium]|nr:prephenate dehydratase [Anaerosomatales bacterium]MDT8433620.1 prephenate dehydratase [Anaerosomatales bacterium]
MTRYAFLGPSGTFTEEALLSLGIPDLDAVACSSIEEVFAAVEDGRAGAGIVPIENSVEGSVNATLDALAFDSSLTIHREVVLDINHALIAEPGATLDEIEIVASHPHATAQCRRWLAEHLPGRTIAAANSTAEAVQRAVAEHGVAAVGTRVAAEIHHGVVLADSIGDYADNKTRFVVVGNSVAERTEEDKTTLALFMYEDRPGALLMILSEFAYGSINLTKIQSRPTKRALGEYMFFVDLEGHVDDPAVALALDCLRLKLRQVKVLGSYPRARR